MFLYLDIGIIRSKKNHHLSHLSVPSNKFWMAYADRFDWIFLPNYKRAFYIASHTLWEKEEDSSDTRRTTEANEHVTLLRKRSSTARNCFPIEFKKFNKLNKFNKFNFGWFNITIDHLMKVSMVWRNWTSRKMIGNSLSNAQIKGETVVGGQKTPFLNINGVHCFR